MITISSLCFIILFCLISGCIYTARKEYKESLKYFALTILSVMCIVDIFYLVKDARNTLKTQAVEHGYAKYEVDSTGSISFSWIIPNPATKIEPVKPAVVTIEKEKN